MYTYLLYLYDKIVKEIVEKFLACQCGHAKSGNVIRGELQLVHTTSKDSLIPQTIIYSPKQNPTTHMNDLMLTKRKGEI